MLDGMSDSIQGSRIENLHSREVDRQSPTRLIFFCSALQSSTSIALHAVFNKLEMLQLTCACESKTGHATLDVKFSIFGSKFAIS